MSAKRHGRYPIPAAPVARLVDRWLVENERDSVRGDNLMSPMEMLADRAGVGLSSIYSMMFRLRNQRFVELRTADRLVSATYGPDAWHVEPELRAALASLPLAADTDAFRVLTDDEINRWALDYWWSLSAPEREALHRAMGEVAPLLEEAA